MIELSFHVVDNKSEKSKVPKKDEGATFIYLSVLRMNYMQINENVLF